MANRFDMTIKKIITIAFVLAVTVPIASFIGCERVQQMSNLPPQDGRMTERFSRCRLPYHRALQLGRSSGKIRY